MTVTLKLSEVVIDLMIAKLQAGLASRVATINTEKADGITITAPADSQIFLGFPDVEPSEPSIFLLELPGADYTEEGPHGFQFTTDIAVVVYDLESDRQRLGRKLLRQARAATEVLWDDSPAEKLDATAFHLKVIRHDPGQIFPQQFQSHWTGVYGVVFRVWQIES